MTKPIHVFWSSLSQRFYASRAYKEVKPGVWEITGQKFDVTDDIASLVLKNDIVFAKTTPEAQKPANRRTNNDNTA